MADNPFIAEAPNGHVVAQRMAGPIILGLPFYWLATRAPFSEGFSFVPGGLAASFAMTAAAVLIFQGLRDRVGTWVALGSTLVFALATPTWSVSADQLWTHTVTQLGIAGSIFAASRRSWWLAGAFLAIGILARPHLALIAAIPGVAVAMTRREIGPVLKIGLPSISAMLVLVTWNKWMFGVPGIEGAYVGRTARAMDGFTGSAEWESSAGPLATELINYLGFWVAPDRGVLVWSPMILVLLPALLRSWRSQPMWNRWLLLGGLAYSFAQLRLNYFPGGDAFWGYRHGLELLTCAVPALAVSLPFAGSLARRVLPVVIAGQFAAFSLGSTVTQYFVHIDNVWRDNSLWMLAREQPIAVATWFGFCIGTAIVAAARLQLGLRWPQPVKAIPSSHPRH